MVASAFPQIARFTHPLSDSDGRVFSRAKDDLLTQGELTDYDLFAESAQQKVPLGSKVEDLMTGAVWRYCKNGAAALLPGNLLAMPVPPADHTAMVLPGASAIGDATLVVTNGATTAIAVGDYRQGLVAVSAGAAGLGDMYRVRDTTAAATGAAVTLTLYDKIRRALAAATHVVSLLACPYKNLVIHGSPPLAKAIGVSGIAVTANYYFWAQTKGLAAVLTEGTLVINAPVIASASVDGAVAPNTAATIRNVGTAVKVGATGTMSFIWLDLE